MLFVEPLVWSILIPYKVQIRIDYTHTHTHKRHLQDTTGQKCKENLKCLLMPPSVSFTLSSSKVWDMPKKVIVQSFPLLQQSASMCLITISLSETICFSIMVHLLFHNRHMLTIIWNSSSASFPPTKHNQLCLMRPSWKHQFWRVNPGLGSRGRVPFPLHRHTSCTSRSYLNWFTFYSDLIGTNLYSKSPETLHFYGNECVCE